MFNLSDPSEPKIGSANAVQVCYVLVIADLIQETVWPLLWLYKKQLL